MMRVLGLYAGGCLCMLAAKLVMQAPSADGPANERLGIALMVSGFLGFLTLGAGGGMLGAGLGKGLLILAILGLPTFWLAIVAVHVRRLGALSGDEKLVRCASLALAALIVGGVVDVCLAIAEVFVGHDTIPWTGHSNLAVYGLILLVCLLAHWRLMRAFAGMLERRLDMSKE